MTESAPPPVRAQSPTPTHALRFRLPAEVFELVDHPDREKAREAFRKRLEAMPTVDAAQVGPAVDRLVDLHAELAAAGAVASGVLSGVRDEGDWSFLTYWLGVVPVPDSLSLDPVGLAARMLRAQVAPESVAVEEFAATSGPAVGLRALGLLAGGPRAIAPFTDQELTVGISAVLVLPPGAGLGILVAGTCLDPQHLDLLAALMLVIGDSASLIDPVLAA